MSFRAILATKAEKGHSCAFTTLTDEDLQPGDVTVAVKYSTVNYKDGLVLSGRPGVVRSYPMIPGIDFAGEVLSSAHPHFKAGDNVLLTGYGASETIYGGFSERARVSGDLLVKMPVGLDAKTAMAIGTAGFTAMLSVMALERLGAKPAQGAVVVTGAAGGVGSIAVSLLANAGWHVIASTGRPAEAGYLKELGAVEILDRNELSAPGKPIGKERWAAGVDSVGSHTLANVLSQTNYGGVVTACGLAQGLDLPASVIPFILRGVTLAGIDSVNCPMPLRLAAWQRLAQEFGHGLDKDKLAAMTQTITFDDIFATGAAILQGAVRGRVVVKIG